MGDPASTKTRSIVVIDDHQDIRSFMQAALEGAGDEVRTAKEGGQAIAMLGERSADLLVTDIFMPGVEGFRTISLCKGGFPQTRIVVVSAGTILGLKHDFLSTAALLGVAANCHSSGSTGRARCPIAHMT